MDLIVQSFQVLTLVALMELMDQEYSVSDSSCSNVARNQHAFPLHPQNSAKCFLRRHSHLITSRGHSCLSRKKHIVDCCQKREKKKS